MNDQTTKLIETLAAKLGTTADHLWSVLVTQARLSATIDLSGIVICYALLFISLMFGWWRSRDGDDFWGFINIILVLGFVILSLITLTQASNIAAGFYNPEYLALREILKAL